jgi:hypothetical protein
MLGCRTHISCTILLHDPHADVRQPGCISALKVLTAAREILTLVYAVWSTSYDITLMDLSCTVTRPLHAKCMTLTLERSSAGSCLAGFLSAS